MAIIRALTISLERAGKESPVGGKRSHQKAGAGGANAAAKSAAPTQRTSFSYMLLTLINFVIIILLVKKFYHDPIRKLEITIKHFLV